MKSSILDSILFHNVEELETAPGLPGWRLQRFPRHVRDALGFKHHRRGRFYAHRACGCELRFVTEGKFVAVTLSAHESDAVVLVYRGDRAHARYVVPAGQTKQLFLEDPAAESQLTSRPTEKTRFASHVWRLCLNPDSLISYLGVESFGHHLRPPSAEEMPAQKWLVYGSSITYGANAFHTPNAYIAQAARRLGVDVWNKGLPGSCLCEPVMAEYLAQSSWDFAFLELGVNLAELATPEEFIERAVALIDQMRTAVPHRRIFVTDLYPNRADHSIHPNEMAAQNNPAFRTLLQDALAERASSLLHYLPASRISPDLTGLCTDYVHPSDEGHILMGERLAGMIQDVLPS